MADNVQLNVPDKIVSEIVQAQVAAKVVEALRGQDTLVKSVVNAALMLKVDATGKVANYSSDNKYTYLDFLCMNAIREATKTALADYMTAAMPKIKAQLEKEFKRSSSKLVQSFTEAITKSASDTYRLNVNVEPSKSSY